MGATAALVGVHRKIISAALGTRKRKLNLVGKTTKLWLLGYHYKHVWPRIVGLLDMVVSRSDLLAYILCDSLDIVFTAFGNRVCLIFHFSVLCR